MGIDIIILAAVAAFIALRLRSELGRTDDMDDSAPKNFRSRFDPSQSQDRQAQQGDAPVGNPKHILHEVTSQPNETPAFGHNLSPAIKDGLNAISKKDRQFNPLQFIGGAENAYPMILNAFWSGDKETLENFLSSDVYSQFAGAVDARLEQGVSVHNRFVELLSAEISAAALHDTTAEITMQFKAEIIAVSKDGEGRIIEGDPSDVIKVNDIWTFARDVKSSDPKWALVGTQSA